MTKVDYYDILEVSPEASIEEIKEAYKSKMLQWHPDRVPPKLRLEAEEKSKQINAAKDILLDERKRAAYNQTR